MGGFCVVCACVYCDVSAHMVCGVVLVWRLREGRREEPDPPSPHTTPWSAAGSAYTQGRGFTSLSPLLSSLTVLLSYLQVLFICSFLFFHPHSFHSSLAHPFLSAELLPIHPHCWEALKKKKPKHSGIVLSHKKDKF